jgi:hypothetical protein
MATGIFLPIVSQFIDKGTAAAAKELKSLQTVSQKAGFAINKAAVPAAAALTGLAVAGLAAAKAAAADAEAQTKLAGQIRRTTGSTDAQIAASEELISSLSMSAAVADDALRPALSSLVTGTKDLGTAQRLLKVALDVSAGAGLDLQQTSDALSKGFAGNTRALASLSPELKVLIREGATFSEVLEVLEKNFAGAAEEAGSTAAGSMRKFEIAIDEAQESIGKALLPILEKVTPALTDLAQIVERNGGLIAGIAGGIAVFAGALIAAKAAFVIYNGIAAVTTAFNTSLAISFTAVQVSTVVGIASAIAGAAVLAGLVIKYKNATGSVNAYADATADAADETGVLGGLIKRAREEADKKRAADAAAAEAADEAAAAAKRRAEELKQQIKQIRDSFRGDFADALTAAGDVLKEAQKTFADYASAVSDSITGAFSFADAKKAAEETGKTFLTALEAQVRKVRDYSVLVNRLIAAGLNESALSQVLAAGQEAGTAIAKELLNGGAAAITQANALSAEVTTLGQNVGNNAAVQFKTAGITAAQGLIAGIESVISSYQLKLKSKKLTAKQLTNLRKNFGVDVDFVLSGGTIPALADGGIVRASSGGTLALIGEGGQDEAVIPLDRLNGTSGGPTIIIQGAVDPISTARQIEKILSGQSSRFGY